MAVSKTWAKLYADLHDHPKTRRVRKGGERPRDASAMGLWVLALSWCKQSWVTDGWVPEDVLDRWDTDAEALAQRLVDGGFWHREERDGEPGYQFHEWQEHQEPAEKIQRETDLNAERMRLKRAGKSAKAVRAHTGSTAAGVLSTDTETDADTKSDTKAAASAAEFSDFWAAYPRKVGKAAAEKAYDKARKSTDHVGIMQGLDNATAVWQSARTEEKFIPHPATWLNQGRWDDEHPTLTDPGKLPPPPSGDMFGNFGGGR